MEFFNTIAFRSRHKPYVKVKSAIGCEFNASSQQGSGEADAGSALFSQRCSDDVGYQILRVCKFNSRLLLSRPNP